MDHPYLVIYSKTAELPDGIKDNDGMKNTCGLCHDPAEDIVVRTLSSPVANCTKHVS